MKTISLHGVDAPLNEKIKEKARQMGLSVNKTVKKLLENSLGLSKNKVKEDRFKDLCGVWSDKDAEEFRTNTEEFRKTDPEDWK
jgi:hypothetical protein